MDNSGEKNPRYKDGRTLKQNYCLDCNKPLKSYRAKRCGSCASRIFTQKKWNKIPKKKKYCVDCGKEISKHSIRCQKCSWLYNGKKLKGKNNPMYGKIGELNHFYGRCHSKESIRKISIGKGGTGIPGELSEYGPEFDSALKEQIRFRDSYKCQECGCTQIENGRGLDIHHIDYDKMNNKPINLISLCRHCHGLTNSRKKDRTFWVQHYQKSLGG